MSWLLHNTYLLSVRGKMASAEYMHVPLKRLVARLQDVGHSVHVAFFHRSFFRNLIEESSDPGAGCLFFFFSFKFNSLADVCRLIYVVVLLCLFFSFSLSV